MPTEGTDRYGRPTSKPTTRETAITYVAIGAVGFVSILVVIAVIIGGLTGINAWHRSQQRANANNQVSITKIHVKRELAQVKVVTADNGVVNAQAEQRYLESVGVKRAQQEIAMTLTPLYNQFEEIQAQRAIATSGKNNSIIYVPAGTNGVPTLTAQAASGK